MELTFTKADLPRYSQRPFPPYRYLPFQRNSSHPHPRNDLAGHSYGQEEEYLPPFTSAGWRISEPYLYGIDLFNHCYWWEAHDALESVWLAAGQKKTLCGRFIQGLIQLSGAQLKRFINEPRGAQSLTIAGCNNVLQVEGIYLGIDVAPFVDDARRCLHENRGEYPRIELHI